MTDVYVVEEIGIVVSKVCLAMNQDIQYMYGHYLEIVNRLQTMTNSPILKNQKFPLIALFTDIMISKREPGFYGQAKLQMIIANSTVSTYDSPQRLEKNFKPILHPIKKELLNQISRHKQFTTPSEIQYDEIDRYYWGKQGLYGNNGNIFNDYIDCVELKDVTINIKNKC